LEKECSFKTVTPTDDGRVLQYFAGGRLTPDLNTGEP